MLPAIPVGIYYLGAAAALAIGLLGCGTEDEEPEGPTTSGSLESYKEAMADSYYIGQIELDGEQKQVIFPTSGCYTGAFLAEGEPTAAQKESFEELTEKDLAKVMWYHAFALGFNFPTQAADMVRAENAVPFIKWEPWSWGGSEDTSYSLTKINNGEFDWGIGNFAIGARDYGYAVWIAFGHEMNGAWYPWGEKPAEYKAAFSRIQDIFSQVGATNVELVFNPNADPASTIVDYYPKDAEGNEYPNLIIAVDGFNWGTTQVWSSWQSFSEIFYAAYSTLEQNHPDVPMIVGEFSCAEQGGDKGEWITDAFQEIKNYGLEGFVWFNLAKEADWRVNSSLEAPLAVPIVQAPELPGSQLRTSAGAYKAYMDEKFEAEKDF